APDTDRPAPPSGGRAPIPAHVIRVNTGRDRRANRDQRGHPLPHRTRPGRPQTRTLRTLLDLYRVEGAHQDELIALLRDARQRGWLHAYQSVLPEQYTTYIGFEGEASGVWNYESLFVPGLLQSEDYARAVIRGGFPSASRDEVERRVQVRMERQDVLRGDRPLELWGIVDEAALRRQVGGRKVMYGQLRYLTESAELPQVTLQVIPFGAGAHAG